MNLTSLLFYILAFLTGICAIAAIVFARYQSTLRSLSRPLNFSALVSSFLVIAVLVLDGEWEPASVLAQSVFWLAGIWFVSLWLNRKQELFTLFQIARRDARTRRSQL